MTNAEIAEHLELYAICLELVDADAHRVRSYQRVARQLRGASRDVAGLVRSGRIQELPGIGTRIGERIQALCTKGTLPEIETLTARIPEHVIALMRLPELGAKRALMLYTEAGIDSLATLAAAAATGRISRLPGIGKGTEAKLLAAARRRILSVGRVRLDIADALARDLLDALPVRAGEHVALAGPQRRRCETIDRLVLLARSRRAAALVDAFVSHPAVSSVSSRGAHTAHVTLGAGVDATLEIVSRAVFPAALLHHTGDAAHVEALAAHAATRSLRLTPEGLFAGRRRVPASGEADLYARLDLPPIAPELRDVIDPAHPLPDRQVPLVTRSDLRGLVHVHSTWSDGRCTIAESARVAAELGATYLVIADHSRSATYARGLSPARARMQRKEIDALNAASGPVHIVSGIEVDVLADGRLDTPDAELADYDVVIASIHTGFAAGEEATFARLERALMHPAVHILGHPTGRFLLERDPYVRDVERLVELCIRSRVAIEINALPKRLDLDWRHVRYARGRGARFVVSSDAHSLEDLARTEYGVGVARKGGLTREDVLNTKDADGFLAALSELKGPTP